MYGSLGYVNIVTSKINEVNRAVKVIKKHLLDENNDTLEDFDKIKMLSNLNNLNMLDIYEI